MQHQQTYVFLFSFIKFYGWAKKQTSVLKTHFEVSSVVEALKFKKTIYTSA